MKFELPEAIPIDVAMYTRRAGVQSNIIMGDEEITEMNKADYKENEIEK